MNTLIPASNIQTMTSEELFKLVNIAREQLGETLIAYPDFRDRMLDELDGCIDFRQENFLTEIRSNKERKVWTLTVEQCMLVSMRESKAVRRSVLHKFKELEVKQAEPKPYSLEDQVKASVVFAAFINTELKLPESGKLSIAKKIEVHFGLPALTPAYGIDAPPQSVVTAGSSMPTMSLTTGLKGYDMSAKTANQILIGLGILEVRSRPSTKAGAKTFKAFTEAVLKYGKNITSPNNPREVQPHFYVDMFPDILMLLGL